MSKAGIRNTVITSGQAWDVDARDHILIVMPFSNFQQRYLLYMALWFGFDASVVMPERMFQELRNLSPTIIVGPPSFFEFLENRINAEPLSAKTTLFLASAINAVLPFHVGRRLARLLCRSWTAVYGSRVRLMFVGSAPTRAATVRLFHRIGLPLFEAYGLTEAGWISFNLPASHCIGSVGRSASGVDISVADDHEILVRSEHPQALGYAFDGVEDQKAVFLPDLTIATGDLGRIDGSGFLHLVGRKKNVIVTRSGLKINPEEIEADIENACQITKAVVADAGRRAILTCVIWLDDWQSEDRTRDIKLFVDSMNKRRAPSHRIGDIVFRPSGELTSDNGLLTRNCKVNRIAVMDKYFNGRNREASWQ